MTPPARPFPWPPPTLAEMAASLTPTPSAPSSSTDWSKAACSHVDPEVFFPDQHQTAGQAKGICAICPLRVACLDEAMRLQIREGVWGGTTPRERAALGLTGRRPVIPVNKAKETGLPYLRLAETGLRRLA